EILLAEDNPVNRIFISKLLKTNGHTVHAVTNGRDVLRHLKKNECDLVLMDIQMPEMDGIETTRAIRMKGREEGKLPIIALTAYAMSGDRERFLKAGMDGYVSKPVDTCSLAREIAQVLGWN
ncbi:MAG: response regulator, partial [Desulfovibrionales bacterium]